MSFKIIISPAKKITDKNDFTHPFTSLLFVSEAGRLHNYLKSLDFSQLKKIYQASDKITSEMMDVNNRFAADKGFLHALYAYDGIQYKTMAPGIMDDSSISYLADHLFIVSGLYGLLRPFDPIVPYRLEMQAKIDFDGYHDLYHFWNDKLAKILDGKTVINLASDEYARAVTPYLDPKQIISVSFKEIDNGRLIEKGVYVKMARGAMVRYLADGQIRDLSLIKDFCDLDYRFDPLLSDDLNIVFTRRKK